MRFGEESIAQYFLALPNPIDFRIDNDIVSRFVKIPMKIGRNDPCPCGSGKKYKKCCMSPAAKVSDELRDLIDDQNFNSIEEAQAFANNHMRQRNQMPSDDFSGLSPDKKIPKSAGKGSTEDLSDFISDLRS